MSELLNQAQSILCVAFFASGVAGLLFETLWFRQAGLAFGNSVAASSIVLASFMAGLAVGNGLMARFGQLVARPIRLYAILEVAIAIVGTVLVWWIPGLAAVFAPVLRPLLEAPALLNSLRFTLTFLLLLVPASAMGATLPLLVKGLSARDASFGVLLGRLYGWNTLGAVVGALVGELALIGWLGIRGSAFIAGSLNLLAAAAALLVARRVGSRSQACEARVSMSAAPLDSAAIRLLAAAFLSGALLLGLEVVWFRFLHLFVHAGSLAFSVILAIVLVGIGLGGCLGGALLHRFERAHRATSLLALLSGALVLILYQSFAVVLTPLQAQYIGDLGGILALGTALTLPVALISGVLFPFIGAALKEHVAPPERATGLLTLANTLGACLGSLAGGFVLLPCVGMEISLFVLGAGYGLVALLSTPAGLQGDETADFVVRGSPTRLAWGAAALFVITAALFPFGMMREHYFDAVARRFGYPESARIVGVREGRSESIIYLEDHYMGLPTSYQMVTGGFSMAGNSVFYRRYMKLFVYWPIAVKPETKSALLISFGIGSTAKALVDTAGLETIDIVDISRDVLEMNAIAYADPAERPLEDPRVRTHIEDGRYFLQSRTDRFDLITAEPPPPKHAGIVNLYTREYFELIRERLEDAGITTYWLPVHLLNPGDSKAIIRAFCDVFESCSLWGGAGYNWMLIGSRGEIESRDETAFSAQWRTPEVAEELAALGLERPEHLGTLFLYDAEQLRALTEGTLPLVDDFPHRLSTAMVDRTEQVPAYQDWISASAAGQRFAESEYIRSIWPQGMRARTIAEFGSQALINRVIPVRGVPRESLTLAESIDRLHVLLTDARLATVALWHLGVDHDQLEAIDDAMARGMDRSHFALPLASRALVEGDYVEAARLYAEAQGGKPRLESLIFLRVYALCMAGQIEAAAQLAASIPVRFRNDRFQREYWEWMAFTFGLDTAEAQPGPQLTRAD